MVAFLLVGLALIAGCDSGTSANRSDESNASAVALKTISRGKIDFIQGYSDGYQRAQEEGKPMLVFFTAQWCNFCHQMEAEAFADSQVVQLASQFVCILVDADQEPAVCQEFRVRGYPTIQFLSARGVPLNRMTGKRPAQQVAAQMQAALLATATRESQTTVR
jgi:thiol:disulfide interchange protein